MATSRSARPRVAMALYGDLTYDSRVRKEARSLAEAGYDVTIVCLASGETRTDLPTNVTILVRLPTGALVIPGSSNPFFAGRPGRIQKLRRRVSWLIAYARGLRSWGRVAVEAAGHVDAWHAHDLTGLAAIVPSLHGQVPIVYDSHELYLESGTAAVLPGPVRWVLRYYEKRLVSRAAALITVNDEIAAELRRRYRPRIAAVVHNCPVRDRSAARWVAHPRFHWNIGRGTGRPVPRRPAGGRGIELLMDALLGEGLKHVRLVLMGYGDARDTLTSLTQANPGGTACTCSTLCRRANCWSGSRARTSGPW